MRGRVVTQVDTLRLNLGGLAIRHRRRTNIDLVRDVGFRPGVRVEPVDPGLFRQPADQRTDQRETLTRIDAEIVAAADLIRHELAFLELETVVAKTLTILNLAVGVEKIADGGFVVGISQPQGRRLDLVILEEFQPERSRAGQVHRVRRLALGIDALIRELRLTRKRRLLAPFLIVGTADQRAELPVVADQPVVADGQLRVQIERDVFRVCAAAAIQLRCELPIQRLRIRPGCRRVLARQEREHLLDVQLPLKLRDRVTQVRRQGAGTVVCADAVIAAAGISESVVAVEIVVAGAQLGLEDESVRDAARTNVHVAAREVGRQMGGPGFLHTQRLHDGRRKDVERNDVSRQVRRWDVRAVELARGSNVRRDRV